MAPHPRTSYNGIALCAGAGGLELGLHIAIPDFRTVCWCERNAYAAATLVARMEDQALDDAPVWSDIATFNGRRWRGCVDIISAGYPCQPFSQAGKRKGEDDPRHLWPHVARILRDTNAPFLFVENVEGHVSVGLESVRSDLLGMGYGVEAGVFSAAQVGASHIRKRLFLLAYADRDRCRELAGHLFTAGEDGLQEGKLPVRSFDGGEGLDDALSAGAWSCEGRFPPGPGDVANWETWLTHRPDLQPSLLGGDHGLAFGVDRLHLAGNGVVPLEAAYAFQTLVAKAVSNG